MNGVSRYRARGFLVLLSSLVGVSLFAQQPILSPRDSSEMILNGKKISVNYGAPSMRGRKIMGELVPYSRWWRTGANEATSFVTEANLVMGGVAIPKGAYTLYTLPSEKRWKLIINKQTGQWGTVYNSELDLARINLEKKRLKAPVERMKILLKKTGNGSGQLRIEWEYTSLSLPFSIKKEAANSSHPN